MSGNNQFELFLNKLEKIEKDAQISEKMEAVFYDEILKLKAEVEEIKRCLDYEK